MNDIIAQASELADRLEQAQETRRPTAPVRDVLGSENVDAAYAVQTELTRRRIARGATVVGRKIGLTSPAVQAQLGVDQPDFGVLFDEMRFTSGDVVSVGRLLQPKVEAEVAFGLSQDLDGELSLDTVRGAVGYACAALEIVDSRVADWDIRITDTVADNGSAALFVLSERRVALAEFAPIDVAMTMTIDGAQVSTGTGAACLGDPLLALLWLAKAAQHHGDPLRAGNVVLSGALGPMAPVHPGAVVLAEISSLGTVSITFSEE